MSVYRYNIARLTNYVLHGGSLRLHKTVRGLLLAIAGTSKTVKFAADARKRGGAETMRPGGRASTAFGIELEADGRRRTVEFYGLRLMVMCCNCSTRKSVSICFPLGMRV